MNDGVKALQKRRKIRLSHVLIALLLAGVAAFAIFRLSTKFKLRARIDAIYAAGYPVTGAELDQWYSIPPDAENAAHIIEEGFSFYEAWDKDKSASLPLIGRAELPARTQPLPKEMKTLIAQYIADNNEALDLFHEGSQIEDCRYPIDLTAGLVTLTPNLTELRSAVMLLVLDAVLHAENGLSQSATRSAASAFGLARSLAREPVTVSQLVRAACQNLALSAVEQVVNRTELTEEQLLELIASVNESERISDMSCAFVGERCAGIGFFRGPESVGPDFMGGGGPIFRSVLALYKGVGMADADAVIYLDLMEGYLKAAQLPMHQRLEAVNAVDARLRSTSKVHVMLHSIMPALSRITTIETRAIAHLRAAQVALAIQRYRLAADRFPNKLADVVPAYIETVPKDPFDGNDLRYKKLEPGFVVYSIGEDLSDDGGKEEQRRKTRGQEPPNWDVVFIVER